VELHLVGGFLGSGKSTAIIEAARILSGQGLRVGIITNEQGKHLVDTGFLRANNLPALDVTGGCFCCHLDDFADRIGEMAEQTSPHVIFAESVGSCTDLVATVIKPLLDWRKTAAVPSSLSVFADSRLLLRYLDGQELPFSDGIIYIFEKQIEETELLVINKIDLLTEADTHRLLELAGKAYPHKQLLAQNSLERWAVSRWLDLLQREAGSPPLVSLDLNYDAYASGEGKFVWFDREYNVPSDSASQREALKTFLLRLADELPRAVNAVAHIKCLVSDGDNAVKLNLTGLDSPADAWQNQTDHLAELNSGQLRLLVNIMAEGEIEPVRRTLDDLIQRYLIQLGMDIEPVSAFERVPGYPQPTMRIGNP
jgi:G3E family GTPase